jgi:trans-AT polyketide synthase/acyltransferase/oxidoreductase domain-containing protein
MLAYLFPGQGSRYVGMGGDLLNSTLYPSSLERQVDEILGYSLKGMCLTGSEEQLRQTEHTQPCLFIVNALQYLKYSADKREAAYFAGHSLGEYNALHAAGAFDILTGLRLVQRRGKLMAAAPKGAMAAVLGIDADAVVKALQLHGLERLDVANFNTPEQVVISGPEEGIESAETAMMSAGATGYIQLQVSAPFHSRYMDGVAQEFAEYIGGIAFKPLNARVLSNVTARPYPMQGGESARELLVRQIKSQVLWTPGIGYLKAKGVDEFIEAGPGMTLANMLQKIPALVLEKEEKRSEGEQNSQPNELMQAKLATDGTKDELTITPESLGSDSFKSDYGVRYAYAAGAMFKGIASKELVAAMGKRKLLSYLGTGGMRTNEIEEAIRYIKDAVADGPYGMNLLHQPNAPEIEERMVDCYIKHGIQNVEAAAYMTLSSAIIRFRVTGLKEKGDGSCARLHRIMAKVSRPEVAAMFMRPAPEHIVKRLLEAGKITEKQAELARTVPVADDICVEADSGGHTDRGVAVTLFPAILLLRDEIAREYTTPPSIRVGAAGGIGTPHSAAAAFIMGADFILTGSVNQCTVEAATSDSVKELLGTIGAQDTAYAPAGDMFEYGAQVQVVRKGLFFHTRANMLYDLYSRYNSLEEIPPATRRKIEDKYFKKTFEDVWSETEAYYERIESVDPADIERDPKKKMAHIFKWYFVHGNRFALEGREERKVDYQIQCGPALGAFNQWVKGTSYEPWRSRGVSEIADLLMEGTAEYLTKRISMYR